MPASEAGRAARSRWIAGGLACGLVVAALAGQPPGAAEAGATVEVRGRLQAPEDVPATRRVSYELSACSPAVEQPEDTPTDDITADHRGTCPVVDGAFTCRLPTGCWHLRLAVDGFVPVDRFDLELAAGATIDLGRLVLRHGGTIAGRVAFAPGVEPGDLEEVRLELTALVPDAVTPAERQRRTAFSRRAAVDTAGGFRFTAVPAGQYRLTARLDELEAQSTILAVAAGDESVLRAPLLLAPPPRLEVVLDPPRDPWQEPWRLTVLPMFAALSGGSGPVTTREEVLDGTWTSGPLAPGRYQLLLHSVRGGNFTETYTVVEAGKETLRWSIDLVSVEGEVRLGDEPLAARLTFGDRLPVSMQADREGRFAGFLSRQGRWEVNLRSAEADVNVRLPEVVVDVGPSGVATLDLELPDTRLAGTVVEPNGGPASRAVVTVRRADSSRGPVSVVTDAEGHFLLRGLAPAGFWAGAERTDPHGRLRSDMAFVSLGEDREAPLRLELRREQQVSGRVLGPNGAAVVGARVMADAEAPGVSFFTRPSTVTGSDGYFELSVPAEAETVQLDVRAPGVGWRVWPLPANGPWPTELVFDGPTGTLVLHLRDGAVVPTRRGPVPILYHPTGYAIGQGDVIDWSNLHAEGPVPWPGDQTRWELPHLEPGLYTACWIELDDLPAVDQGERPARLCTAGALTANGRLELSLPPDGEDS